MFSLLNVKVDSYQLVARKTLILGDNYAVCHRAPYWVPNYPTFRFFEARGLTLTTLTVNLIRLEHPNESI